MILVVEMLLGAYPFPVAILRVRTVSFDPGASGSDSSLCLIRQALDQATESAATLAKSINWV
jgi:hypothetical protein